MTTTQTATGSVVPRRSSRSWLARPGANPGRATWLVLGDVDDQVDVRRLRRAMMRGMLQLSESRHMRSRYDGMCAAHPALRDPCIICDLASVRS